MQRSGSPSLMKMTGSLQMIEQPEVMFGSFTPLIQSFFGRMTADQWQLLKSGTPDDTTTSLLAELLMNIVTSVSNGFLAAFQDLNVMISTEDIQARLGDTLSESFAEVLGVQDTFTVSLEASERLKDLVVKEVSETVNSILKEPSTNQRITPPRRLRAMLRYTLTMLKRLMRNVCIPRVKEKRRRISPPEIVKEEVRAVEEGLFLKVATEARETARSIELMEKLPLDDSFVVATTKAALDIIRREVGNITEPLLEEVGDADYEVLQSSVSQEIENVADDVAQLIAEETVGSDEAALQPAPKREAFLKASQKIKAFFAKCRAKAWILCMVAPYKKKSQQSRGESTESLQLLLEIIDSLFVSEEGDPETAGKQMCVFPRLKDVSQGRDPQFTKQLIEMIDNYINGTKISDFSGKRKSGRTASDPAIDNQSQSLVLIFLSVMKWWLETQADQHVDRVTLELTGGESYGLEGRLTAQTVESLGMTVSASASAPTVSLAARAAAQLERKKIAVKILVEHVVSHIVNKARVSWAVDHRVVMERLFLKSWAQVEDVDFPISGDTFVDFDKVIFKTLCKRWGNAKVMLLALTSQETAIEDYITSAIRNRLIPRSNNSVVSRVCSWLGKAFRR